MTRLRIAGVRPEVVRGSREIAFDLDGVASASPCNGAYGCSPVELKCVDVM